ncbi:transmembrane Fragile-X-F protein [Paenibacillus sp. HN-1]|nr:transmembrane Fragile-X-F protein [Paenibacillus sp. CGMCC 1.18879]MBY9083308.1 transmembrane Fragile-X-F protein [Paenibacillus sinensis]
MGFFGLLAIVFITLKLTGVITWNWWLVLLPLWGPFAIAAVVLVVVVIVKAIVE